MWNGRSAKNTGVNKWQKWQESNVWREQKIYMSPYVLNTPWHWKRASTKYLVDAQTALWAGKGDQSSFSKEITEVAKHMKWFAHGHRVRGEHQDKMPG